MGTFIRQKWQGLSVAQRWVVGLFAACALVGGLAVGIAHSASQTERDSGTGLPDELAFASIDELIADLDLQQLNWLTIAPPDPDFFLHQPCGRRLVNLTSFPPMITSGLLPEESARDTAYPVTVAEDPATRWRLVLNAAGEILAAVPPPAEYDPEWFLQGLYPDLFASGLSGEQIEHLKRLYDPARIAVEYELIAGGVAAWRATVPLSNLKSAISDAGAARAHVLSSSIAGGEAHSAYARADGTAWAWGLNKDGQLGAGIAGKEANLSVPMLGADGKPIRDAQAVAAGKSHTVLLKRDGTVWLAGKNAGDRFVPVASLNEVLSVAAGDNYGLALTSDGTVHRFPLKAVASDGDDDDDTSRSRAPSPPTLNQCPSVFICGSISSLKSRPTSLAAHGKHAAAVTADGTVWTWQLEDDTPTPARVRGLPACTSICIGDGHYLALAADGTVWAWGENGHGQLGCGGTKKRKRPVQVEMLSNVIDIAAGAKHSLALTADRQVWAWGANGDGQLGDESLRDRTEPTPVPGATHAVGIAAGGAHSLILQSSGITVWTCGANDSGQLGTAGGGRAAAAVIDSDGDRLPDAWEYEHVGNLRTDSGKVDHIRITALQPLAAGTEVVIGYPAGFAGPLDVFRCTGLRGGDWSLLGTTNASKSFPRVTWNDDAGGSMRFYAVGNGDHDADHDGLASARERYVHRTDMNRADTDGDTMPDGWEVSHSLDPRRNDANEDADGDGLPNADEYTRGMNPRNADEDADRLRDGWEVQYFGSIADPDARAGADPDGDGWSNLSEQTRGGSPLRGWSPDTKGELGLTVLTPLR